MQTPAAPVIKADMEELEEGHARRRRPRAGRQRRRLGLVYGMEVDDNNVAVIDMTLTSAAAR